MITSKSNAKIKNLIRLQKSSERKSQNLVPVEGKREIERALLSKWQAHSLFFCEELAGDALHQLTKLINPECETEQLSREVFEHIAYREGSDGLYALFKPKTLQLGDVQLPVNALVVVLEGVEKPGNLGAVLRTTDAAGVDIVVVCDPATDLFNPNVIRSSLGCVFSQQVVATSSQECIKWLKKNNIQIFCTALTASKDYLDIDLRPSSALVMGTEATGLSPQWLEASDQNIIIPMKGIADSLNVSVTTAIMVFEALRQRNNEI